jgi:uncharacterized protein (TIGR02722 family)
MKKTLVLVLVSLTFASCSSFKAQRVGRAEGDEKALSVTDKWVQMDTENTVKDLMKQMESHPSFQAVLRNAKKKPKIFIGEVQNETSEPYFPIGDINDELLNEISYSGKFTLIDAEARNKILKEIQYQNDGMVDPAQAKSIGKQFGADLLVLGAIRMQPESRDGKTIKQYSVNLRMTNLETSEEVLRIRTKTQKYSEQSGTGW